MPTSLTWRERGVRLTQATQFPYAPSSTITIEQGGAFTMLVRHPSWAEGFGVRVNGEAVSAAEVNGYLPVSRTWSAGDVVEISLPMKVSVSELQNYTDYVAFKYGPILLGAKTGTDGLTGLFADESRMGHCASGEQKNIYSAPLLIGSRDALASAVELTDADSLFFRINGYYSDGKWDCLVLRPFSTIHESRYMMYWLNVEGEKWEAIQAELQAREDSVQLLESRTIDYVITGTQQSESDHSMKTSNSSKGSYNGEYWRDGEMFSYLLQTDGQTDGVTLMVRYWGGDGGNRQFDILVDNTVIATESLTGGKSEFVNVEYAIPAELLADKTSVRVKFKALEGNVAGGVYYLRLLRPASAAGIRPVAAMATHKAIYTLGGTKVERADTLPRGIYVVDGKKCVLMAKGR